MLKMYRVDMQRCGMRWWRVTKLHQLGTLGQRRFYYEQRDVLKDFLGPNSDSNAGSVPEDKTVRNILTYTLGKCWEAEGVSSKDLTGIFRAQGGGGAKGRTLIYANSSQEASDLESFGNNGEVQLEEFIQK